MTIRMPRRLIWQLDKQIETQKKRVQAAQAHLDELVKARMGVEPLAGSGKEYGGLARAESLTPERRSEIASQAAKKRWSKG